MPQPENPWPDPHAGKPPGWEREALYDCIHGAGAWARRRAARLAYFGTRPWPPPAPDIPWVSLDSGGFGGWGLRYWNVRW